MRVLVLGSGVIGVTTAYYLAQAGHEVTVVDRGAGPASETSHANGGQISVSHAEPWANPGTLKKLPGWLLREDAPLLFRPQLDPALWRWALGFLNQCRQSNVDRNIREIVKLGTESRQALQDLRAKLGLFYYQQAKGILHFYTNPKEFEAAAYPTQLMQQLGCDRKVISAKEAIAIEPALGWTRFHIAGATYTAADESGDAQIFTQLLKIHTSQVQGVHYQFNTQVLALKQAPDGIYGVDVIGPQGAYQTLTADAYVVCLGSYSPLLVKPLGIHLPIYPAKGYSATVPVKDPQQAHTVSLTDDEYKLVFSRFGENLRIAGTAEFAGYNRELNVARCRALIARASALFPEAGHWEKATFWSGLRPATPSNVPIIGKSAIHRLFFNTGHGTLGWTHACGSGQRLAQIL